MDEVLRICRPESVPGIGVRQGASHPLLHPLPPLRDGNLWKADGGEGEAIYSRTHNKKGRRGFRGKDKDSVQDLGACAFFGDLCALVRTDNAATDRIKPLAHLGQFCP